MRQHARQHLEAQLRRLAQQRDKTKQKLRALTRQIRQAQRYRQGAYVELAGLAHLDPGTLLGGLCELAAMLTDPECVARWKVQGEARLDIHRRRKAHRRRPGSSVDGGSSDAETKCTQA
jgi:conjugative transfer protein TraD